MLRQVDGISLHNYFGNEPELAGGKSERFLAQNLDMERQIQEITAVADYVQGLYRSPKQLWLSFDEWNVWYRARTPSTSTARASSRPSCSKRSTTSRTRMLTGGFLNTLMRQSDRVRVACLAQIVNVIAPLVTNSKGVLRQSIYYPYQMVLKYARGRMLDIQVESETYPIRGAGLRPDFARNADVPFVDVVATYDAKDETDRGVRPEPRPEFGARAGARASMTSRLRRCSPARPSPVPISRPSTPSRIRTRCWPRNSIPATAGAKMSVKLPARSYTVMHLAAS